jgi:hypothetical protein
VLGAGFSILLMLRSHELLKFVHHTSFIIVLSNGRE